LPAGGKPFPLQKKQFSRSFSTKKSDPKIFIGNWIVAELMWSFLFNRFTPKDKKRATSKTGKLLFLDDGIKIQSNL